MSMAAAPDPGTAPQEPEQAFERARFLDRFVAFSLDLMVVVAASLAAVAALAAAGLRVTPAQFFPFWIALFFLIFVAYHAVLGANGLRTLGKLAVGLQVYTQEGYPPSFKTALGRACAYLLSNLFCVGYIWALFQSEGLALHDILAGTMVVEVRPKGALGRTAVGLASVAFVLLYAASAVWPVAASRYYQMRMVANSKQGVLALSLFEEKYKSQTGAYTGDLNALARLYGNPQEFFDLLGRTLDLSTLAIKTDGNRYEIRARALDRARTPVVYRGPYSPG
jgi:uncharacterized RDD family membrane protein YckC